MSELEDEIGVETDGDEDEAAEDEEGAEGMADALLARAVETAQEDASAPAPPVTDLEAEKRATTAEKRWQTFAKTISGIYEEDGQYLYECPLCPSQHKGFVDIRFAGRVPEDLAQAVTSYVRGAEQVAYLQDPEVKRCVRCGGLGKTATDSLVPGKDLIVCKVCVGYGYTPPPVPGGNGYVEQANLEVPVGVGVGPLVVEDVDTWGHPKLLPDGQENPNYGKMPQYVDPRYP